MNVTLVEFNLSDLLLVCLQLPKPEQHVYETMRGYPYKADEAAAEAFGFPGLHWNVVGSGDAIAAGGFIRQRDKVFRTWLYATDRAWTEHGAALTETVRDAIQQMLNKDLAHRIETLTLASHRRARAWYERIGLKHEATLRGYCPNGEDAVSYVVVKTEKT